MPSAILFRARKSRLGLPAYPLSAFTRWNCLRNDVYYTYVLHSEKDSNLYIGFTKNLKQRFDHHERGKVDSTKDRRPLKLIYYEACTNREDATSREKYFKTHYGRMFLKKRLKFYFTGFTRWNCQNGKDLLVYYASSNLISPGKPFRSFVLYVAYKPCNTVNNWYRSQKQASWW